MINNLENLIYDNVDNYDYNDHYEETIFNYIKQVESFIDNYGYDKEICFVEKDSSIEKLEYLIKDFLILNANTWNHLEILGTLKGYPNKTIYVCCYEPYGEEVLCIENKNNKLFFFNYKKDIIDIRYKHIEFLDKFNHLNI